jgi:hypothetical protein
VRPKYLAKAHQRVQPGLRGYALPATVGLVEIGRQIAEGRFGEPAARRQTCTTRELLAQVSECATAKDDGEKIRPSALAKAERSRRRNSRFWAGRLKTCKAEHIWTQKPMSYHQQPLSAFHLCGLCIWGFIVAAMLWWSIAFQLFILHARRGLVIPSPLLPFARALPKPLFLNRRQFLKTTSTALAALSAASYAPTTLSAEKPRRVVLIGAGWYGKRDLWRLVQVAPVEIVAICDPDQHMLAEAVSGRGCESGEQVTDFVDL